VLRFLDSDQLTFSPGVICLGFFDGVHLGHQAIVNRGKTVAAELNLPLYVHTSSPKRLRCSSGWEWIPWQSAGLTNT